MAHLLTIGSSSMIFKHFHDGFYLNNFASGFSQSFQFCFHITCGNIHQHIVHVLGMTCLITMVKPFDGVCSIVVGKALYCFDTSHIVLSIILYIFNTLLLPIWNWNQKRMWGKFSWHLMHLWSLFGLGVLINWHMTIALIQCCEVWCFKKLYVGGDIAQFCPFVLIFYTLESHIHHNPKGEITIIPWTIGTHKVTPLVILCLP